MSTLASGQARTIVLLACAAFASMGSMRVCDSMLPRLAQTFETTTGQAAYTISGFAIAYGLMQLAYGFVGDRYGKLRIATFAALACTLTNIACSMAPTLGWLTGLRVLAGATAGGVIPLALAWIGDTVPYERRQATLARFLSGNLLGLISGQMIGGLLADTVGWRWAFGALACVFGVVGLLLWRQGEHARDGEGTAAQTAAQGFAARVRAVLAAPWARVVLLTVFCEGALGFASLAFVPAYVHDRFGLSLTAAGAVLAVFGIGGLLYTLIARRLIARLGEIGLARYGGTLIGAAFVLLLLGPGWSWSALACLCAGLGLYMLHNTLQANATQMAPQARGTAVALFATALFLGQSIGVAFGGAIIDRAGAGWIFAVAACGLPAIGWLFGRALPKRDMLRTGVSVEAKLHNGDK
jgi:predicted MFS family arabinose efflux permease